MAKSKTIVRGKPPTTEYMETPLIEKAPTVARDLSKSLSDDLAQDLFYYKNYFVDGFHTLKPHQYRYAHVSRMYPNARGGRLYIDEYTGVWDDEILAWKKKTAKELKLRYIVLYAGMSFEQAMLELEEVTRGLVERDQ